MSASPQHDDRQARTQSLRLLKSKLRATGRRQQGTINQTAVVADSNQHEEDTKVVSIVAATKVTNGAKTAAAQDAITHKHPADAPSTIAAHDNQDDILVEELRRELSELKARAKRPTADPPSVSMRMKTFTKTLIQWMCDACERECIPVREESRCLCGHRYKEHPASADDPRVKTPATFRAFACTSAKCSCKAFFYVVAEGAWILRCRCKHKHTDHDPTKKPFKCKKPKCGCGGFDSPWVCNCDHPWSAHRQHRVTKTFNPLQLLQDQCELQDLNAVQRTDLLAAPLALRR